MAENSHVSLLFPWIPLERQVTVMGVASKITATESAKYFASRPRASQIGAWISNQSSIITSRNLLLTELEEAKNKFLQGDIPLPDFWGGYRVVPQSIEFWQGRTSRLHDRFLYTKNESGFWTVERLAPYPQATTLTTGVDQWTNLLPEKLPLSPDHHGVLAGK